MALPRFTIAILLAAAAIRCAVREPPRDVFVESTSHLRAGCYRCLQEGLALVEGRSDVRSRVRAFEFAVLLAARAKELGLPFVPWLARAKSVSAAQPPAVSAPAFLAAVGALRQDPAGLDRDQDLEQRRSGATVDLVQRLDEIESSAASLEVKTYFALAIACNFNSASGRRDTVITTARRAAPGVPLLEYALGSCRSTEEQWLVRALEHEPRFDDAAYPLAQYLFNRAAVNRPESDPTPAFARARAAFADSPAIAYTEAMFFRMRSQWARALEDFDATLRFVPTHHDARLGRVVTLSSLERHRDAIAGATSLIDENKWLVGDAYYWRAWNQFALTNLDDAERDVEQAKQRLQWSPVFVLSGLVQWRKDRPPIAESEFVRALDMAPDACEAASHLGAVRAQLRKWQPASEAYAHAETCRNKEVLALRATLDDLVAHAAPSQAVEAQQKSIAESEQHAAEMAYNRGVMLVNAGDVDAAKAHIERGGQHPSLQAKAADLLQRLKTRSP